MSMDRNSRGGDFFRPPPTSPRGPPKKRPRREWAPRPREDTAEWSSSRGRSCSTDRDRFQHDRDDRDEDARESKPLHLGNYPIQLGNYPIQPEFKIRGNSFATPRPTKSEAGCDPDQDSGGGDDDDDDADSTALGSLGRSERAFVSAMQSIVAQVQNIESAIANYAPTHAVPRAVVKMKKQLSVVSEAYHAMGAEMQGLAGAVQRAEAREDDIRRDLEDARTANFKLSCAKKDLSDQVSDLKSAAAQTEVERRRLKREIADAEAKAEKLESSVRELQEERAKTTAEKLWLEETVRKREAEAEKAAAENGRLQRLVDERDAEIEKLKSNALGLQSLVQQRAAEVEEARAESARLQGLVREKDAQLASLGALPVTPLSPLAPLGPFSFPVGPVIPAPQAESIHPGPPGSPLPYIKQEAEALEATAEAAADVVLLPTSPPLPIPAEQPPDLTQQLHQLGAGATELLSNLLGIKTPARYNPVLSRFLTHLGTAPDASTITVTKATDPWLFDDPWTPDRHPPPNLPQTSVEAQLAQLCLLFPFPGSTNHHHHPSDDTDIDKANGDLATFHLLTSLLASLTKADYSSSPRAGLAFLQTMSTLDFRLDVHYNITPTPATATATTTRAIPTAPPDPSATTRTAILKLMLAELCRTLERTCPDVPRRPNAWFGSASYPLGIGGGSISDVQTAIPSLGAGILHGSGLEVGGLMSPIDWLATVLREVAAGPVLTGTTAGMAEGGVWSGPSVRGRLASLCGAQFCSFLGDGVAAVGRRRNRTRGNGSVAAAATDADVAHEGENTQGRRGGKVPLEDKEMGLLHCGEGTNYFLMIDFEGRRVRLVDCRLARWEPHPAEPRKMDLVVARAAGDGQQQEEEEELWRLEAAPKDVAAFWVGYICYG